jgi:hypothetical protein
MVASVPFIAPLAPIIAITIAHIMLPATIVEHMIAIAWIPITVIPATAKTNVGKAIAAVAIIISVIGAIGITIIIAPISIAIAAITQAQIINAA